MKKIGSIGMGFVGEAVFKGFQLCADVRGYDVDPLKSKHTFEETIACDFVFIAVPTPMETIEGGRGDLCFVHEVLQRIVDTGYDEDTVFVIKSTIPIGTTDACIDRFGIKNLVHNPEFLTERNALEDFNNPSRQILGGQSQEALTKVEQLYSNRFPGVPVHVMSAKAAEQVKYVANCFFAVKVSFFNEMWQLSDRLGTEWDDILTGVLADGRIGKSHSAVPGHDGDYGYGGKCLPKDINALIGVCEEQGLDPLILKAAWAQNKNIRTNWDWADIPGAVSIEPKVKDTP